jgi:hypothetical protein
MQKFTLYSLVDITETKVFRNSPNVLPEARKQQQNFDTTMQILGLRANIYYDSPPQKLEDADVSEYNFGTALSKDVHTVWKFDFEVEYDGAFEVDSNPVGGMLQDFDLIPIITNLDETAKINNNVFLTADKKYKNISFNLRI